MLLILFQLLCCMEDPQSDKTSCILSLIMYKRPLYLHHNDICSLALVNKQSEKAIKNTASDRRNHLEALDPTGSLVLCSSPVTWHKYGSMCTARAITRYSSDDSELTLYFFTYNGNTVSKMCSNNFNYHAQGVREYQSLFNRVRIDDDEGIFFYSFSKRNDQMLWGKDYHVIEYSCSKDGKSYLRRCAITIKDTIKNYALSYLITFPVLFKALLQAPIVKQDDEYKFYDLNSAIIPDNFQEVGKDYLYLHSFEQDLPEELRRAIIAQFAQQNQK